MNKTNDIAKLCNKIQENMENLFSTKK